MNLQLEKRLLERLRHQLDTRGSVDPVYIRATTTQVLKGGKKQQQPTRQSSALTHLIIYCQQNVQSGQNYLYC